MVVMVLFRCPFSSVFVKKYFLLFMPLWSQLYNYETSVFMPPERAEDMAQANLAIGFRRLGPWGDSLSVRKRHFWHPFPWKETHYLPFTWPNLHGFIQNWYICLWVSEDRKCFRLVTRPKYRCMLSMYVMLSMHVIDACCSCCCSFLAWSTLCTYIQVCRYVQECTNIWKIA